jgi:hypothetical protein
MNRRELFKGIAAGLALSALPKAVRAAAILPRSEVCFYEVGGQTLFPIYGASGGLACIACCFPFIKQPDGSLIVYRHDETMEQRVSTALEGDIKSLQERALRAFDEAYVHFDMASIETREDGCEFPQAGGIIRIVPRKPKEMYYAA